jgi:anaerobic glycerol-3-phosphate dehydrogenase
MTCRLARGRKGKKFLSGPCVDHAKLMQINLSFASGVVDLFGEIPVTWPEVWDWLEAVAGIERTSWRAPYYIEHWNVPAKIRAAKAAGTYYAIIDEGTRPARGSRAIARRKLPILPAEP